MMEPIKERDLPTPHRKILSVIPTGSENAIKVDDIRRLTGITRGEDVRRMVAELITRYGYMIAGSNDQVRPGYYIIETEEERDKALHNLMSRIRHMSQRAAVLRQGRVDKGQLTIDDLKGA